MNKNHYPNSRNSSCSLFLHPSKTWHVLVYLSWRCRQVKLVFCLLKELATLETQSWLVTEWQTWDKPSGSRLSVPENVTGPAPDQNNQVFSPHQTLRSEDTRSQTQNEQMRRSCALGKRSVQRLSQRDVSVSSQHDLTTYVVCACWWWAPEDGQLLWSREVT